MYLCEFYKNMKTEKQKGPWISWYDFLGTTQINSEKMKIIEAMADMNMTLFDCLYIYRQMYGLSSDDKREIIKKYKKETNIKRKFQRILNQNNNSKRLRINNDDFFKKIEDAEIIQFIYQHYIDTLWYDVINKKIDITEDIINIEPVGDWNTKIRTDFLFEYEFANNYKPVNGLSYKIINENTKEEEFIKLNLMQKLIIVRSVKYLCYGNFSEPGTGKTIGDICLSREINAKITVIFAINSTIKKVWEDTINRSYLDSNVIIIDKFASIDLKISQIDESKHNYILINYEKLQIKEYSIELLNKILKLKIDKITFDETQNLKEADESDKKIRRRNAEYFVNNVRKNNPNIQISVLTATPIVNNLFEPKSILKLLTGKKYDEINSHKSLDNLLNIHALIMSVGIRFILPINMEYKEDILNINGNSIYDKIFTNDENGIIKYKNKNYVNDYKLMLPLKLNAILPYLKKGVIIYSHFVEGFIDETREFLQKHGYSVAVFTGEEKPSEGNGGLDDFMSGKCDILVTSDPITTGMNGLQFVSDTLIPITLPWTHAMWHQLIHRIYRQLSKFKVANIIIPCVEININDKVWCFDKDVVLRKINYKKQLSDYSLDSEIYEQIDSKKDDYSINRSDFLNYLNKQKHSIEVVRENVDDVIIPDEKLSIDSIVQKELQLAMVSYSETYSNHVKENEKNWILYHENRKTKWKVNPTEELAKIIKQNITNDHIIVDAGCGLKAEFADLFPNNKVYSYDLSNAGDNRIIVQDISHLPLHNDKSVDIVIQSQAWECLNFNDYVKEAYRILKDDGRLYIVQSKKDWDKSKVKFENTVINNNFKVENIKVKNKKNYITLSKN